MDSPNTPVSVETTPVVVTPIETPVATGTPQQQARTDVYNQYASLYETSPTQVATSAVLVTAPVVTEPAVVAPVVDNSISEMKQAILDLQKQNGELLAKLAPPPPPTAVEPTIHPMQKWVELMASNKLDEAQQFFIDTFGPQLQAKLQPQMIQQSVEANRAELEIERFVTKFESDNSDLLHMKDYVVMGAERRLSSARTEGKITDPASFVREYQKAVTDEANALREKFQLARGAGKTEAQTSQRAVLSATTLSPSPMQTTSQSQPSGVEDPSAYMNARRNKLAVFQGLGPTN